MRELWTFLSNNETLLIGLGFFSLISLIASVICVPFVIARIPVGYFSSAHHRTSAWREHHPVIRFCLIAIKNVLGIVLLLLGLAMLVLPGQGLITILIGLFCLDFPGKYRLERRLLQQKNIRAAVKWIRQRTNQPPLKFD